MSPPARTRSTTRMKRRPRRGSVSRIRNETADDRAQVRHRRPLRPAARVNHRLNAMILILLALSGMSLFHPALFFLSDLFGGGTWTRILHFWLGLALLVSFTGLFLRFWRYNLWER